MANKTEIANLVLIDLGVPAVSSLTDGSTAATTLNAVWDNVRDAVLGDHTWNFAKKWVNLAADGNYAMIDDSYEYAYELPNDYIRMSQHDYEYVRRGDFLLSNEEGPLTFEYIYQSADETRWPEHFIFAFASRMKGQVANKLTNGSQNNQEHLVIYKKLDLPVATKKDADESLLEPDLGQHTESNDGFLTAR